MVWYLARPDAMKVLAAAGNAAKTAASQTKLDEINADAGWVF